MLYLFTKPPEDRHEVTDIGTLRVRSLAEPHKVLSADSVLFVLLFSSTRSSYGKGAFVSSAEMKNTFNKAPFFKAEITLVIPHVVRNLYLSVFENHTKSW